MGGKFFFYFFCFCFLRFEVWGGNWKRIWTPTTFDKQGRLALNLVSKTFCLRLSITVFSTTCCGSAWNFWGSETVITGACILRFFEDSGLTFSLLVNHQQQLWTAVFLALRYLLYIRVSPLSKGGDIWCHAFTVSGWV